MSVTQSYSLHFNWNFLSKEFTFMSVLGTGTFGQVVRAKHNATNLDVAIKFINTDFDQINQCRNVLREISILKQLSGMADNIFTNNLLDIIIYGPDQGSLLGA